jgi:hypothetical protein
VRAEHGTAARASPAHIASAFGVELHSAFELPGVAPARSGAGGPTVQLSFAEEDEINGTFDAEAAVRLSEEGIAGAEPYRTVDFEPVAGYRLYARYFGLALVSADGARVQCAPPPLSPWRWQRFLMGRVIPLAAMLRGREMWHASAVELAGLAVGFAGPSGAGKSSLALALTLTGARLVADDVLALTVEPSGAVAYPGAGVLSLRDRADPLALGATRRGLVTEMGWSGKAHLVTRVADRALSLGAFYFLEASDGRPWVEAIDPPDPRRLLSCAFVHEVTTSDRLRRQLDVCSEVARGVPLFTLKRGDAGPVEAAAVVRSHALGVLG